MPRRAFGLLLAGLLAWGAAAAYIFQLDPEVPLARSMLARKRAWAQRCDAQFPAKVVIYGGSSCAFSIDGERLEEHFGLPTVNMAMSASLGMGMLTRLALPVCREGDTLIVALETGLLIQPYHRLMSAAHLAYALGEPALLEEPGTPETGWPHLSDLLSLRPDGARTCSALGKWLLHRPSFRYRLEEVSPSGYQWTAVRVPLGGPPPQETRLSADARRLFTYLHGYAQEHRLRLSYSLPWVYTPAPYQPGWQAENLHLVREIQEWMPVLRDPLLGTQRDATLFADTQHHLTREGARLRTDGLGQQLTTSAFWDAESLAAAEQAHR